LLERTQDTNAHIGRIVGLIYADESCLARKRREWQSIAIESFMQLILLPKAWGIYNMAHD